MRSLRHLLICLTIGATVAASLAPPASAQAKANAYDGLWTVLIVTSEGPCNRSYRYPVRISRGSVRHSGGDAFFSIQGRVNARGAVNVTLSRDGRQAQGSGRLSASSGSGSWSAAGGICSGKWSASRRG